MNFRTIVEQSKSEHSIDYSSSVFLIGSCFADEIGSLLIQGKFDSLVNPFGVLYNPESIASGIDLAIDEKQFSENDLFRYDDNYLSFKHDTSFSSRDKEETLTLVNKSLLEAASQLRKAKFLFVTFGTARIFRLKEDGRIVSNCHKLPADKFTRELMEVADIVKTWESLIDRITDLNPDLQIVFTVSPVRHWKDGAHGNQVSKSVLFIAIEELLRINNRLSYFPSYEIMMDDLRDYRFYKDDMLHPSEKAIRYVWEIFSDTYFIKETADLNREISKLVLAMKHRLVSKDPVELARFKSAMLKKIRTLSSRNNSLCFSSEIEYFENL